MSEKREVIIWTSFKYIMKEGETIDKVHDLFIEGEIDDKPEQFKITDLEGNTLLETEF